MSKVNRNSQASVFAYQFGYVVMVGMGGIYLEVYRDIAFQLAPVDRHTATVMVASLQAVSIIDGLRGTVYDKDALIDAVVCLSHLGSSIPHLAELDINPFFLYARGQGGQGVDALIRLDEKEVVL